jgi:5-formyltetrahydrofolate cyclo-ligase
MTEHPSAGDDLTSHLDVVLQRCGKGIYAAYLPIRSELSPLPLVAALADRGIVTAMPVTPPPGNPLTFYRWAPGMRLDDGPYGTKQPPLSSERVIPDVILAPMLAFDAGCWRLGYGGGFYDRSIAELRESGHEVVAIGIAFGRQQVDKVPTGSYDMPLDAVWTPDGVVWRDATA